MLGIRSSDVQQITKTVDSAKSSGSENEQTPQEMWIVLLRFRCCLVDVGRRSNRRGDERRRRSGRLSGETCTKRDIDIHNLHE